MEKRWIYRPLPAPSETADFARMLNTEPAVASLLLQRGISTFDQAKTYFRPTLDQLHDPFLMRDMDRAVFRLTHAIDNGEKIVIYGDYDVDGTTSVALFYGFLRRLYSNLLFYIPDRYLEGYGVSRQGIEWARDQGVTLMVSLDCGIKSVAEIGYAKSLGIDFIVCDHHLPGSELPPAYACLDPKRSDCPYPYKELSGCGVGFKLLQAFCTASQIPTEHLYCCLDLLAVSICCDIVPMTGENRVLAYYGMLQLNAYPCAGLSMLKEVAALPSDRPLSVSDVLFKLGPRINAAGRIEHARASVELLLAQDEEEARTFAEKLDLHNRNRQTLDRSMTEEALQMIEDDDWLRTAKTTVLYKSDWSKGVVGIVAAKCVEKYHRPTIILTESNQKASGSARSVPGFDVHWAISECAELLEHFGGHTHAAGLTLKLENVQAFQEKFERVAGPSLTPEQLIPQVNVDGLLRLSQITTKLCKHLHQMTPFGPGNMQPLFVSENIILAERPRILKENHLKLKVRQHDSGYFDAIGFNMAHHLDTLQSGRPVHLCYHIEENTYNGRTAVQLRFTDVKMDE